MFFLGVFYTIILASASFAFDCLLSFRFSTERALAERMLAPAVTHLKVRPTARAEVTQVSRWWL